MAEVGPIPEDAGREEGDSGSIDPLDGGEEPSDAGIDGGNDAGFDAGTDAGVDAGADGGADAGPGPLECVTGSEQFRFTVTQSEQSKRIALPLQAGVVYRRLELRFGYTPTQWSGTCYNPATSKGSGFPIFESLVALKRGAHWCKGGNLFETTLQGPASGHGASNKARAETHYKPAIHTGSGCGSSTVEATIFSGLHGISPGSSYSAELIYDGDLGRLTADVGPSTHSGPIAPGVTLVANPGETWYVVLSFDGGFLECYDSSGQHDPTAPCCWGPSLGWVFENLSWRLCK